MKLAVLGSTGSIGLQTLDVCRRLSPRPEVVVLAAHSNCELLTNQAREFGAKYVVLAEQKAWREAKKNLTYSDVLLGEEGLQQALAHAEPDVSVNAVWGAAGLKYSLSALRHSRRLALANKESLVAAGQLVMGEAREWGCEVFPVDSEQSAIFQAMHCGKHKEVRRVILTASGGPFLDWTPEQIASATPEDALKHPTWEMGRGITVDSATLMNKAFEVIETRWLFDLDPSQIEVVIHPESVVHSMVEFVDGSCVAQLNIPDMRIPIQYSLTYPERVRLDLKPLDFAELGSLTFQKPDTRRFRALMLAWQVLEAGGAAGAVLVAANQRTTAAFLEGKIGFDKICDISTKVLHTHNVVSNPTLDDILAAHDWAMAEADRWISREY